MSYRAAWVFRSNWPRSIDPEACILFNQSTVGDVVKVTGSPRKLEAGNGYTDWNVSWSDWLAGSALQG